MHKNFLLEIYLKHRRYFMLWAAAAGFPNAVIFYLKNYKPAELQMRDDLQMCLLFFALLSPIIYFFGVKGLQSKNNIGFMSFFYGSFMIKLFLSLGFVMIYLSQIKHVQWSFIAVFGLCYFLFSGIETACLMMANKKKG